MTLRQGFIPFALVSLIAFACDDSNSNPMPDDSVISAPRGGKTGGGQSNKAGKGGSEGSSGKGGETASGAGKGGQAAGSGGSTSSSSGGTGGNTAAAAGKGGTGQTSNPVMTNLDCKDKTDCFCGAPKEQKDFLNQCTEATCMPFDNSKLKWNGEGNPPAPVKEQLMMP